jgi:hypothetical protein
VSNGDEKFSKETETLRTLKTNKHTKHFSPGLNAFTDDLYKTYIEVLMLILLKLFKKLK